MSIRQERTLWIALAIILLMRLLALGSYPLMDTSEARYAEMARKMVESGDWITPMFDYNVPFWGKPPLSFWTQAASMQLFGINEFSARLPAWLFHVGSCFLIIRLGTHEFSRAAGIWAAIIFSSTALGFVASGVSLTDPALSFSLLLASYGFWRWINYSDKLGANLGFIGLGLGLLAKGPLILILMGLLALSWVVLNRQWQQLFKLPWLSGLSLMLMLAVPWYVAAELKTPGFLDYFFIGEHWSRYVVSKWEGDLYGSAHARPYGTIWLQLGLALFPWILFLPRWLRKWKAASPFEIYLWLWALVTPIFFTFAGNILWTYLLPALPAWALLLASKIEDDGRIIKRAALACALILPTIGVTIILLGVLEARPQNQRDIVRAWLNEQSTEPAPLIYPGRRSYSSEFYSSGESLNIKDPIAWPKNGAFYLSRRLRDRSITLPSNLSCTNIAEANASQLLRCSWQTSNL